MNCLETVALFQWIVYQVYIVITFIDAGSI